MNIDVFIIFGLQSVQFAASPHENTNIIGKCMYRFVCVRQSEWGVCVSCDGLVYSCLPNVEQDTVLTAMILFVTLTFY